MLPPGSSLSKIDVELAALLPSGNTRSGMAGPGDEFRMHTPSVTPFEQALNAVVVQDGFLGSKGTWRRRNGVVINCIGLQQLSDGSSVCVNLGVHFTFLPLVVPSQVLDVDNLQVEDCEIRSRLAWPVESDHWWKLAEPELEIADLLSCYEQVGRPYYRKFLEFPRPLVDFKADDVEDGSLELLPLMTKVRKLLLLARVHDHLGNAEQVASFCSKGIEVAGRASGPKAAFRELQRKYKSAD